MITQVSEKFKLSFKLMLIWKITTSLYYFSSVYYFKHLLNLVVILMNNAFSINKNEARNKTRLFTFGVYPYKYVVYVDKKSSFIIYLYLCHFQNSCLWKATLPQSFSTVNKNMLQCFSIWLCLMRTHKAQFSCSPLHCERTLLPLPQGKIN